jgi:hypothetical protein
MPLPPIRNPPDELFKKADRLTPLLVMHETDSFTQYFIDLLPPGRFRSSGQGGRQKEEKENSTNYILRSFHL